MLFSLNYSPQGGLNEGEGWFGKILPSQLSVYKC